VERAQAGAAQASIELEAAIAVSALRFEPIEEKGIKPLQL
jgi:hypothetical protein